MWPLRPKNPRKGFWMNRFDLDLSIVPWFSQERAKAKEEQKRVTDWFVSTPVIAASIIAAAHDLSGPACCNSNRTRAGEKEAGLGPRGLPEL